MQEVGWDGKADGCGLVGVVDKVGERGGLGLVGGDDVRGIDGRCSCVSS